MEEKKSLFRKDAVFFLDQEKQYEGEDILHFIGKRMAEKGYAKESFEQALIEREKKFPTGLQTAPYPIAIPHADMGHANASCIGVVRLRGSACFSDMVEPDKKVHAKFIFCIVLSKKEQQTDILQEIMQIAADEELMEKMEQAGTEEELYDMLSKRG